MWPSRIAVRAHRREQQPVEVAVLHVEHERRRPRHAGDAEQDRRRHLERRVVEARRCCSVSRSSVAMFTTKKNSGDEHRRDDGLEVAGHGPQGPAGDGGDVVDEAGRAGRGARRSTAGRQRWSSCRRSCVVVVAGRRLVLRSSSCSMRVPVSSRNTSSSVGVRSVRSRTATSQPASATATGLMAAEPLSVAMTSSLPCASTLVHAGDALERPAHTPAASPSTRATMTSVPTDALELGRACPRRRCGRWSMMPTRSASSSASSRYWVVRKIVMPSSLVEPAHLVPHAGPAHRVEPGGGLVEEQDLGVVHERGGEVEPALHAARVGGDAAGRARRRGR